MLQQPLYGSEAISLWYADMSVDTRQAFLTSDGQPFYTEDGRPFLTSADEAHACLDPLQPDLPIRWHQIRYTKETLSAYLTSAPSEAIRRAPAEATTVLGEVSGEIHFEVQANTFLRNALVCALMDETHELEFGFAGLTRAVLRNGSRRHPLMVLKRVALGGGLADYTLYLGVEIDSLSLTAQSSALVTGSVSLFGREAVAHSAASSPPPTWTFVEESQALLMSGADALEAFGIVSTKGERFPALLQNLTVTINNQLRQQHTVGHRKLFPEGLGVGRIQVTYAGTAYYASRSILQAMLEDLQLQVSGRFWDAHFGNVGFLSSHVKPRTYRAVTAERADQDLVHELDLQAFQDEAQETLIVIVGQGRPLCGTITYFQTTDGKYFFTADGKPVVSATLCDGDTLLHYLEQIAGAFVDEDGELVQVDGEMVWDDEGLRYFLKSDGSRIAA